MSAGKGTQRPPSANRVCFGRGDTKNINYLERDSVLTSSPTNSTLYLAACPRRSNAAFHFRYGKGKIQHFPIDSGTELSLWLRNWGGCTEAARASALNNKAWLKLVEFIGKAPIRPGTKRRLIYITNEATRKMCLL